MEDDPFAGNSFGERRSNLAGRDEIHVPREQPFCIGIERCALAQAEPPARGWLDEEVQVRVRPEVGPGRGAEGDQATQAVAASEGMEAPVARDGDPRVEVAKQRSAFVAMPGPIGKRAVDGACENPHPESAVAGSAVIEQALAQGGLVEQLEAEPWAELAEVGERAMKERLVHGVGEAPDDDHGTAVVCPTELDCEVGAGKDREHLDRLTDRQREADGRRSACIRAEHERPVTALDKPIVLQHAQGAIGAGEWNLEDRRDLGRTQTTGSLREGDERAQAVLGRDETTHERIVTLSA